MLAFPALFTAEVARCTETAAFALVEPVATCQMKLRTEKALG